MQFIVTENEANIRIDKFLKEKLPTLSRSQIQKKIESNEVLVNNNIAKKSYHTEFRDKIDLKEAAKIKKSLSKTKAKLETLYEDEDIIVVNKPPFIPVHPDNKVLHHKVTLVNILLGNKTPLSSLGGDLRPGIVHRLDKDTSGLLIVAKTDFGYQKIREQFETHQIQKTYLCLTYGKMEAKLGRIEAPLARDPKDRKKIAIQSTKQAKHAISEYKILKTINHKQFENTPINLLEVKIPTGRTHQIRVHFASIKHPLIGDSTYGITKINQKAKKLGLERQFLHAHKLKFKLPSSGKSITIKSDLAPDLTKFLEKLEQNN